MEIIPTIFGAGVEWNIRVHPSGSRYPAHLPGSDLDMPRPFYQLL